MRVHGALGSRRTEMSYEAALAAELTSCGLAVDRQVELGLGGFASVAADLVVGRSVAILIYAIEPAKPELEVSLKQSLARNGLSAAYILNFSEEVLENGIVQVTDADRD
jgi:GxxExxY protein